MARSTTGSQGSDSAAPDASGKLPKPIVAAAGAGDLAVEKLREASKRATERFSSLETDPSTFADRIQENLESRADQLGTAFRSASEQVRGTAKDLSDKAQTALQSAFEHAGETYDQMARRGEDVVVRFRSDTGRALGAAAQTAAPDHEPEPPTHGRAAAAAAASAKGRSGKGATGKGPKGGATTHRKTSRTTAKRGGS